MCFVWIWEQTAIISLYNINWLVCITETECVYCAVRTGSLYNSGHLKCLMALPLFLQSVAGLSLRWTWCIPRPVHMLSVVGNLVLDHWNISCPVASLFPLPVSFHQCSTLISFYMLLLSVGQTGQVWVPAKNNGFFFGNWFILFRKLPSFILWSLNSVRQTTLLVSERLVTLVRVCLCQLRHKSPSFPDISRRQQIQFFFSIPFIAKAIILPHRQPPCKNMCICLPGAWLRACAVISRFISN